MERRHAQDAISCAIASALGSSEMFTDFGDHRVFYGKLTGFQLGIDQGVIQGQFETTATGGLQFNTGNLLLVLSENFGRQTDGLWLIISRRAIAEMHFHGLNSSWPGLVRIVLRTKWRVPGGQSPTA